MKSPFPFFDPHGILYTIRPYCGSRALWIFLLLSVPSAAQEEKPQGSLVVRVRGFAHDRGQAVASLFRVGDDVFKKASTRVVAKVEQGEATLVFPRLSAGSYAVTAFHDQNGNDDLDHNFLRFPSEPLGFSNGFKLTLTSGLPNFEKLRFDFEPGGKPIEIFLD